MSQMLKSSGAMAAATLTSRLLGMVREMVYASFMGIGWVTDAFVLAFMVPNLFRRLLGEGALTAAFIPVFKEKEKLEGEAEMWRAANAVISGLVLATLAIVVLGVAGVSLALHFGEFPGTTLLMLRLLRLTFPYLLMVTLAAVFMAMLNARGFFFIPAMGATMLNVVMIAAVYFIAPHMGTRLDERIFGLGIGVLLAGVFQAGFQLPVLRREGFRFRWITPWGNATVRLVVRKMVPGMIGVAAFQLNVLLTQGMAYWVDKGIVSSFNYAVRLMELPQGVFGISLATFMLPALAGLAAEKKYPEFRLLLRQGIGHLLFVNLLASALLLVLAEPIIRLLFERGRFDAYSTSQAAYALVCLAPSLVAYSVVNVVARAFYALGDTKTPMRVSIFCLGFNVVLVFALVWRFKQGGMGIANTLSATINVGLLLYALRRKLARLGMASLLGELLSMLGAALAAGLTAWLVWRGLEPDAGSCESALETGRNVCSVAWRQPALLRFDALVENPLSQGDPGPNRSALGTSWIMSEWTGRGPVAGSSAERWDGPKKVQEKAAKCIAPGAGKCHE